ncbi:hypothetical protein JM946_21805 [Steroidobacter sp. S1-65]|uniref:Outer membrane protein beta-barrel domain-containing protein n=1 Tax=Steroidobacter gossypii TaxID=2805490 RepID=A0ABS1X2D2_9GAMM|nr:hypothetical protein [Steroidobacter gossypii]MBM0107383.1 hypothetical protein [Steroidobacter gossypii]
MRTTLIAVTLLSAFGLETARAGEDEWQITPRGFSGDLDIKRPYTGVNGSRTDADLAGIGCGIGYLTPVGIVAAIGADGGAEFDLFGAFDSYSFDQQFVAVGYQFELGNGWRFVPMVGRTRWRLESEEGLFLNPGPEASEVVRGYDYYWEASVSRRISEAVALGISYKQGDYRFGQSRATAFMVTVGL